MAKERRVRQHPRMSVPKFGDYFDLASAADRERLLRNQKFMPTFVSATYRMAYLFIRKALLDGGDVRAALARAEGLIHQSPERGSRDSVSKSCSVEAIRRFGLLFGSLELEELQVAPMPRRGSFIAIAGVRISVFPIVRLTTRRRGEDVHGALLLVFRKEKALGDRGGKAIAEIMRRTLRQEGLLGENAKVAPDLCRVVDVFSQRTFVPPTRSVSLFREVESCCREVARLWPSIVERDAA